MARESSTVPSRGDTDSVFDEDREFIAALQQGHCSPAAAALFDRYASHIHRVLTRVLGADAELPDLVNEVFLSAVRSVTQLRQPGAVRSWLTTIAVHTARRCIRRRYRRRWLAFFSPTDIQE